MEQQDLSFGPDRRRPLSVTEFTEMLRGMLEEVFPDVWISGEISGVKVQPSGHIYFTLKDGDAVLSCVSYRNTARFLRFKPRDGAAVLARGRVDIWPPSGRYQLIVEAIEPKGRGSLHLAFEELKQKLNLEGLFDPSRKKTLPPLPRRIGIITSPTGAVIQDILRVLNQRFSGLHIRLYPTLVQGEGSVQQICEGLQYFNSGPWADVLILARGGGSIEDLWTFNEEPVARAIASSTIPVISAIGHETDFTIADFVADLRAPTPSAAADLVIQSKSRLLDRFTLNENKLTQSMRYRVATNARKLQQLATDRTAAALRRRLGRLQQRAGDADLHARERIQTILRDHRRTTNELKSSLLRLDIRLRLTQARSRQQTLETRLANAVHNTLAHLRSTLQSNHGQLTQLSPLKILDRGYAVVMRNDGAVVREADQAPPNTLLSIRFANSSLQAKVTGARSRTPKKT